MNTQADQEVDADLAEHGIVDDAANQEARGISALSSAISSGDNSAIASTISAVIGGDSGTSTMTNAVAQKLTKTFKGVEAGRLVRSLMDSVGGGKISQGDFDSILLAASVLNGDTRKAAAQVVASIKDGTLIPEQITDLAVTARNELAAETTLDKRIERLQSEFIVSEEIKSLIANGAAETLEQINKPVKVAEEAFKTQKKLLAAAKRQLKSAGNALARANETFSKHPNSARYLEALRRATHDLQGKNTSVQQLEESVQKA